MLALAKVSISSMGLLTQHMFVWTFPWSHAVPSRPVLSQAALYHNRSSLRGKGSLEVEVIHPIQDTLPGTGLRA